MQHKAQHSLNLCRTAAFQGSLLAPPAACWLQELGSRLPPSCLLGRICLLPFCVGICFVIYLLRPSRIYHKIQDFIKILADYTSSKICKQLLHCLGSLAWQNMKAPLPLLPSFKSCPAAPECYIPSAAGDLGSTEVPSDVSLGIGSTIATGSSLTGCPRASV